MALKGECFREQKGRLTQRIKLGEKYYFIKQHFGVGFKEIFKNILQGRWPVLSAKNEWLAINKLQSLGIAVAKAWGFGLKGSNPARLQSFILMEELTPVISLEELGKTWRTNSPRFDLKLKLIKEVAHIARTLHQNGLNHRDFYLCHFLLDLSGDKSILKNPQAPLKLFLIDLHRTQIRANAPKRWIIKDLGGLYFSSVELGLTQRDCLRFIKYYHATQSLREILTSKGKFWHKVKMRGEKLYHDHL